MQRHPRGTNWHRTFVRSRTLKIRKELNLFANLRPAYLYEELKEACPLRDDIIGDGFDMMIMRELTGGLYFGERHTTEEKRSTQSR